MLREGGTDAGIRLGCSRPQDSRAVARGFYAEGRTRPPRPAAPPPVRRAWGQGKAPPPPLKMEVMKRAPPARPPHGRAATNFAGASASWGSAPTSPGPPLTHRPVAQDGDLPGLGLRHLGGLLSPDPTTLTAAAAAPPAQTIGGGCAGRTRHTEHGGGRGCLSLARSLLLYLAQPPGTERAGPPPTTHPRDRARPRLRRLPPPPPSPERAGERRGNVLL